MKRRIRRARDKNGRLYTAVIWEVYEPNGEWSGSFETLAEAVEWATSIATRLEYWLSHQVSK